MADARRIHDWNQSALICVLLANPNRDTKKRKEPYKVEEIHPYGKRLKKIKRLRKPSQRMENVSSFLDGLAIHLNARPQKLIEPGK